LEALISALRGNVEAHRRFMLEMQFDRVEEIRVNMPLLMARSTKPIIGIRKPSSNTRTSLPKKHSARLSQGAKTDISELYASNFSSAAFGLLATFRRKNYS
jgi:hypothetical protein